MTTLAIFIASLFACSQPTAVTGQTLALQDDAGVVALTWDGATAKAWRDGQLVREYSASTWESAMWSVDLPAYGEVTAPHRYDRVLSAGEIRDLSSCRWAPQPATTDCGLDSRCDCTAPPASRAVMAALK